jgi:hypothetical protein
MTQNPATPIAPQAPVAGVTQAPSAAQMLQAAREMRSELRNQLSRQQSLRRDLAREIDRAAPGGPQSAGLEARLAEVDARITALDKQLAVADQQVAQATAVPGAVVPDPPRPIVQRNGPSEEVVVLGTVFMVFVLMPLAVAYARRLWKRGATALMELPAELSERLTRLEQAVDAVAVELERVGEGQRYVTNLFADQGRALGPGAAEPLGVREREAVHQARR